MSLSILDFLQIITIPHLSTLFYSKLCPKHPILEFLLYSVPQYLVVMFLDKAYLVFISLLVPIIVIPGRFHYKYEKSTDPIDRSRMLIIFLVMLAIFAADFKGYDSSKLGKSMDLNFRLMDVGVGSFVYNAGLVSYKAKNSKKMVNFLKCFIFGTARFLSKIFLKIDVREAEFGRHLNFFYDLGFLNLITMFFKPKNPFFTGVFILLMYQGALSLGLDEVILNNRRENIFMANLEGILFLIPQLSIIFMSQSFGRSMIEKKRLDATKDLMYGLLVFLVSYCFQPIARRLHNMPFCSLMFASNAFVAILFDFCNMKFGVCELSITKFGSKNMLNILIIGNLMIVLVGRLSIFKTESTVGKIGWTQLYLFILFYLYYLIDKKLNLNKSVI